MKVFNAELFAIEKFFKIAFNNKQLTMQYFISKTNYLKYIHSQILKLDISTQASS